MPRVLLIAPPDAVTAGLAARLVRCPGLSVERGAPGGPLPDGLFTLVVFRPALAAGGGPDLAAARACFAAGPPARDLLLLGSAAVHEPGYAHPGHVAEDRLPPLGRGGEPNRVARAWRELETLAESWAAASPGARLVVLRPTTIASRGSAEPLARLLAARLALPLAGHDPAVQLLHPDDLAEAVARAVEPMIAQRSVGTADAKGEAVMDVGEPEGGSTTHPPVPVRRYHVAPAGVVPLRAALRGAGVPRLPVPFSARRLARRQRAHELDYLRYPWTVSGERLARELGFVPRRSSAEAALAAFGQGPETAAAGPLPDYDPFGLDRDYIAAYGRTLFRFLHRRWWRLEVRGLEHVPREGPAVLAGIHRGFMPWDGVMVLHTLVEATGRVPRFLIHPALVKFPFLANYMTKLGGIVACRRNADWVLGRGELLGMFPEGIRGAFSMYRDAYRLKPFGHDEFVRMALRNGAPIVPFVTLGTAETFPILARLDWAWWRRFSGWPFLPITPTFPLLPVPLPTKWHLQFLPPLDAGRRHPPEAARDMGLVRALSAEVRARMEEALEEMRRRRRSLFRGSVFPPGPEGVSGEGQ